MHVEIAFELSYLYPIKNPQDGGGSVSGGEEKEFHPCGEIPHRCLSSSLIWAKVTIEGVIFSVDGVQPIKG
jgi:hypothetical protein